MGKISEFHRKQLVSRRVQLPGAPGVGAIIGGGAREASQIMVQAKQRAFSAEQQVGRIKSAAIGRLGGAVTRGVMQLEASQRVSRSKQEQEQKLAIAASSKAGAEAREGELMAAKYRARKTEEIRRASYAASLKQDQIKLAQKKITDTTEANLANTNFDADLSKVTQDIQSKYAKYPAHYLNAVNQKTNDLQNKYSTSGSNPEIQHQINTYINQATAKARKANDTWVHDTKLSLAGEHMNEIANNLTNELSQTSTNEEWFGVVQKTFNIVSGNSGAAIKNRNKYYNNVIINGTKLKLQREAKTDARVADQKLNDPNFLKNMEAAKVPWATSDTDEVQAKIDKQKAKQLDERLFESAMERAGGQNNLTSGLVDGDVDIVEFEQEILNKKALGQDTSGLEAFRNHWLNTSNKTVLNAVDGVNDYSEKFNARLKESQGWSDYSVIQNLGDKQSELMRAFYQNEITPLQYQLLNKNLMEPLIEAIRSGDGEWTKTKTTFEKAYSEIYDIFKKKGKTKKGTAEYAHLQASTYLNFLDDFRKKKEETGGELDEKTFNKLLNTHKAQAKARLNPGIAHLWGKGGLVRSGDYVLTLDENLNVIGKKKITNE